MAEKQYQIDAFSAAELARIRKKVDSVSGPYVKNAPDSIVIGTPPPGGGKGAPSKPNSGGVTFKIYSQINGRVGRYQAKIITPPITPNATGTLAEANLGTLPTDPDAIAWHVPEIAIASAKHMLKTNVVYTGRRAGADSSGNAIILFSAMPVGETASATTFSPSGATAESGTWSRASNGTPVTIALATRAYYDTSAHKLYHFTRSFAFDACGLLISISAETRVETDAAVTCT